MKIYKYDNYEDYVTAQSEANVKKIKNVFLEDQSKLPKDIFIFLSKCLCLNPK